VAEGNEVKDHDDDLDFDDAVDLLATRSKQQRRKKNIAIIVAVMAAILATAAGVIALVADDNNDQQVKDLTRQVNTNADKTDVAVSWAEQQRKQFELCKTLPKNDARCAAPVIPPTVTISPERPPQPPGNGLSAEDIRNIVAAEVARRNLTVTPAQMSTIAASAAKLVPKPKDGKTPTNAELQPLASAAVATFCANDACRGKDGLTPADGKDALPPSDERLTEILTAYCSTRNGCIGGKGDQGDKGGQGDTGATGNGIKSTTISGETITFAYTDGTSDKVVVPLCPAGSSSQKQRVMTEEFPLGVWVSVCVLDDQNP